MKFIEDVTKLDNETFRSTNFTYILKSKNEFNLKLKNKDGEISEIYTKRYKLKKNSYFILNGKNIDYKVTFVSRVKRFLNIHKSSILDILSTITFLILVLELVINLDHQILNHEFLTISFEFIIFIYLLIHISLMGYEYYKSIRHMHEFKHYLKDKLIEINPESKNGIYHKKVMEIPLEHFAKFSLRYMGKRIYFRTNSNQSQILNLKIFNKNIIQYDYVQKNMNGFGDIGFDYVFASAYINIRANSGKYITKDASRNEGKIIIKDNR